MYAVITIHFRTYPLVCVRDGELFLVDITNICIGFVCVVNTPSYARVTSVYSKRGGFCAVALCLCLCVCVRHTFKWSRWRKCSVESDSSSSIISNHPPPAASSSTRVILHKQSRPRLCAEMKYSPLREGGFCAFAHRFRCLKRAVLWCLWRGVAFSGQSA